MIRNIGIHRADDTNIIDALGDAREQITDLNAALAVLLKLERRLKRCAGFPFRFQVVHRQGLTVEFGKNRLGIERVYVRRTAIGEDVNDALGFAWKLRDARRKWAVVANFVRQQAWSEQLSEPQHSEAHAAATKKIPPREEAILQSGLMMWRWHV